MFNFCISKEKIGQYLNLLCSPLLVPHMVGGFPAPVLSPVTENESVLYNKKTSSIITRGYSIRMLGFTLIKNH